MGCALGWSVDVGARVNGVGARFVIAALVVSGGTLTAQAEDLVMPFACRANGSNLQIAPANETVYRIAGRRDEQPFAACSSASTDCKTMMVHRFSIECDGATVAWSRIAVAAKVAGVAMPAGLPNGFAPVSTMSGRFVLPALTRSSPALTKVATQDLSPDSVIERSEDTAPAASNTWVTEVRADVLRAVPGSPALRIAGSLAAVFAMLFAASMVAARRWRLPSMAFAAEVAAKVTETLGSRGAELMTRVQVFAAGRGSTQKPDDLSEDLANAMSFLLACLQQAEASVAALGPDLLLRDVLSVEVNGTRTRVVNLQRQLNSIAPPKAASVIRALLRDLERINRIAQSAAQSPAPDASADFGMPQSANEAYRVLGINADAAPAVAKKLVDALHMSWHPDHARDEADRVRREGRMKQINAAWDLIKERRAAA